MSEQKTLHILRNSMISELTDSILPYWMEKVTDRDSEGFHGRITGNNEVDSEGVRSAILNTRILWTFSSAYRVLSDKTWLPSVNRAFEYLNKYFVDHNRGGLYWSVNANGGLQDTRKHTYTQSFAIYAFSEMYLATGNEEARELAVRLFNLLERHAWMPDQKAYYEAFDVSWNRLEDVRLSNLDQEAFRSTNTHLHLIEAFTTLFKVWPDDLVKERLRQLLDQFLGPVYNAENKHFHAFFDASWNPISKVYSFGHDIETVWLMMDAARVIGDTSYQFRISKQLLEVAYIVLEEGIDDEFGGLYYTGTDGTILDSDKRWWAQAEAVVGFYYAYELSGDRAFLSEVEKLWDFINSKVIDRKNGEWFYKLDRRGSPCLEDDKVGFWKCPYHSARACLEIHEKTRNGVVRERPEISESR